MEGIKRVPVILSHAFVEHTVVVEECRKTAQIAEKTCVAMDAP